MLTPQRERQLVRRMRGGDEDARSALVVAHLRLVLRVARDLRCDEVPLVDLAQEGLIGLTRALHRFDPALGVRLSTFAERAIRGAMLRAIEQQGRMIRLPRVVLNKLGILKRLRERLAAAYGSEFSTDEITQILTIWQGRVPQEFGGGLLEPREMLFLAAIEDQAALFGLRPNGHDGAVAVDLATLLSAAEERVTIQQAVRDLGAEEQEIIVSRFGLFDREREQLDAIAARMELSRLEVRMIERRALMQLSYAFDRALIQGHLAHE